MSTTDLQNITAIGLIALFIIVLKPIMPLLVQRLQNKTNSNGINKLKSRLDSLENNHINKDIFQEEVLKAKIKQVAAAPINLGMLMTLILL